MVTAKAGRKFNYKLTLSRTDLYAFVRCFKCCNQLLMLCAYNACTTHVCSKWNWPSSVMVSSWCVHTHMYTHAAITCIYALHIWFDASCDVIAARCDYTWWWRAWAMHAECSWSTCKHAKFFCDMKHVLIKLHHNMFFIWCFHTMYVILVLWCTNDHAIMSRAHHVIMHYANAMTPCDRAYFSQHHAT
jgi:hypothetical protein